jgi:dTDP-4-amino-4,6-dideoxygalactose transaminase
MQVRFVDLQAQYQSIKSDIDLAIARVINDSAFIGGKYVKEFEEAFAEIYGVKHVISCANGTDSIFIILKMLGVGIGDEVITVANSWISSAETISLTGAKPVFVDIESKYHSIDERSIEKKITKNTKGIIAVHLQGQMCAIDEIKRICDRNSLFLIEDCAQAHFSEFAGIKAGLFGIAGSFSFFPGKNLGAYGDAGCIITNNDALAKKCRMFANHGALKKHQHEIEGINSRLDGLQASILLAKLPYIQEWTEMRTQHAKLYNQYLSSISDICLPQQRPCTLHSYHLYVIRAQRRDQLAQYLRDREIEVGIHYPIALPNLPAYSYLGYSPMDFPVATHFQSEILSLPMYPELSEQMIQYIAETIIQFYK